MTDLKRTPLYEEHVALEARMVPFAGFEMPVQYPTGIRAEHEAVRTAAGMFDVSHMGEFLVSGAGALDFVSYVTTNDPSRLGEGQAQYSMFCRADGTAVDDLIVYRLGDQRFRLVVNGANLAKDWEHLSGLKSRFDVRLEDESDDIGLIALQGPRAQEILAPLSSEDLEPIGFYEFAPGSVAGIPGVISRTGYTGEDGFELYVPADRTAALWRELLEVGRPVGLIPAGLGSRDSLRLEMGYALYGNDLDDGTTPLEAGLSWLVKLGKPDFLGREALQAQKDSGPTRRLRGFRLSERSFPRPGYEVVYRDAIAGTVRSGTLSPTLDAGIGTAYLPAEAEVGDPMAVRIRGRDLAGHIVQMPFYRDGSVRK